MKLTSGFNEGADDALLKLSLKIELDGVISMKNDVMPLLSNDILYEFDDDDTIRTTNFTYAKIFETLTARYNLVAEPQISRDGIGESSVDIIYKPRMQKQDISFSMFPG